MLPDDGAQQAGFADAVAAEHAGHLAGLGMQRNAAQRLRRAVVQIDIGDVEHGDSPYPLPLWERVASVAQSDARAG